MKKIMTLVVLLTTVLIARSQSEFKSSFNNTLKAYFETKNALAKDDAVKASTSAKEIIAAAEKLTAVSAKDAKKLEITKQAAEMIKYAKTIVMSKDIKVQRNNFGLVSSAVLALTRSLQLNQSTVYVQYCPMAKKYWLNEVEAVQNPYYGSMMYDCGDVSETIASK